MSLYNYFLTYKDDVLPATNSVLVYSSEGSGKMVSTPLLVNPETGAFTLTGDFTVSGSESGSNLSISVTNTATAAASGAFIGATVTGASSGDAYYLARIAGGQAWTWGLDTSASDSFVLAASATLGTSNVLSISTTGDIAFSLGNISLIRSAIGNDVFVNVTNTDNTQATSDAGVSIITGGASAGDPYILMGVNGASNFSVGIDNSASDNFVISAAAGLGISNVLSITNLGVVSIFNNLVLGNAGNRIQYTSGANAATGTATLVAGTVTVSTTAVTANSKIKLTRASIGATGAAATGNLVIGTVTAGVSFVINSVQAADATALQASDVSTVTWEISELV
jgi:hypothetical protein